MTERNIRLDLELLDDAVFSERPASAGAHAGLDYIPGSALLGWAAGRLYSGLSPEDAWLLFHSGKVRFAPGVPLAPNGRPAYPAPLSLHFAKGDAWRDADGRADAAALLNLARAVRDPEKQYQQVRQVWLTLDGLTHHPARELAMKTAIDPETGRSADSQLYGYDALRAMQRFSAGIEADADVPDALLERLKAAFDGVIHLGRSRSSQYGRVRCRVSGDAGAIAPDAEPSREVTLWVLSDLAVARNGQPCLAPEPADLGLPAGRLLRHRSFVRSRAWSPYNGWRRAPDVERQVIAAGSVLTYELDEPVDVATLPSRFGLWRECGLGRVAVNPVLLSGEHPLFEPAVEAAATESVARPDHPLIDWLSAMANASERLRIAERNAERMAGILLDTLYPGVRRLGSVDELPPGPTQWGRVREVAMAEGDGERLLRRLFGEDGVIKAGGNNTDWNAWTSDEDGNPTTIRDWLKARIEALDADARADTVALLAQRMSQACKEVRA